MLSETVATHLAGIRDLAATLNNFKSNRRRTLAGELADAIDQHQLAVENILTRNAQLMNRQNQSLAKSLRHESESIIRLADRISNLLTSGLISYAATRELQVRLARFAIKEDYLLRHLPLSDLARCKELAAEFNAYLSTLAVQKQRMAEGA